MGEPERQHGWFKTCHDRKSGRGEENKLFKGKEKDFIIKLETAVPNSQSTYQGHVRRPWKYRKFRSQATKLSNKHDVRGKQDRSSLRSKRGIRNIMQKGKLKYVKQDTSESLLSSQHGHLSLRMESRWRERRQLCCIWEGKKKIS